jgi:hypothetical protein
MCQKLGFRCIRLMLCVERLRLKSELKVPMVASGTSMGIVYNGNGHLFSFGILVAYICYVTLNRSLLRDARPSFSMLRKR